jgi:hypothetical protein
MIPQRGGNGTAGQGAQSRDQKGAFKLTGLSDARKRASEAAHTGLGKSATLCRGRATVGLDETSKPVLELLEKWRRRARTNQRVHYARAEELQRYNRLIGTPSIILSAVVGTSIFATLRQDVVFWARMAVGTISFVAAILAGLQTYFKFSERAAQHHAVAASY